MNQPKLSAPEARAKLQQCGANDAQLKKLEDMGVNLPAFWQWIIQNGPTIAAEIQALIAILTNTP